MEPIKTDNQRLWEQVRKWPGSFTCIEVASVAGITAMHALKILRGWQRAGYVSGTSGRQKISGRDNEARFELVRDNGLEAPRVNAQGKPLPRSTRELCWHTMRRLATFTLKELQAHASIPERPVAMPTVKEFVRYMVLAGYVLEIEPRKPYAKPARYRMKPGAWTGPNYPRILMQARVIDGNTSEVRWENPLQELINDDRS